MNQVSDLIALLALTAVVGLWFKSTRARERAVDEARQQCARHGLQLLDETVGLRGLRLRRHNGRRRLEVGYAFEVSVHGDDRLDGRLWMCADRLAALSLPSVAEPVADAVAEKPAQAYGNVIPLRPRHREH